MQDLTLAEKKTILQPKADGLELIKLTILEMVLDGKLLVIESRNPKESVSIHSFVRFNSDAETLVKHPVFQPFAPHLEAFKKFQISLLLKFLSNDFKSDFGKYRDDFVIKNLRESHGLVSSGLLDRVRGKFALTEKGKAYQSRLQTAIEELREKLRKGSAFDEKKGLRLLLVSPESFTEVLQEENAVKAARETTNSGEELGTERIFGNLSASSFLVLAERFEFASEEVTDVGTNVFEGLATLFQN